MIYKISNGALKLMRYKISIPNECDQPYVLTGEEKERDAFLNQYSGAKSETLDNSGVEWMDGMRFTPEQIRDGEIELAAEMGEAAYKEYAMENDRDAQMLDLDFRISLLELGVCLNDLSIM